MLYIMVDKQCGDAGIYEKEKRTKLVLSKYREKIDSERKLISRILHDSVNQKLIVMKLLLQELQHEVPVSEKEAIKNIIKINDEAYSECRDIISTARVETLETFGVVDAIQELIDTYKKLGRDIDFDFRYCDIKNLDSKIATNVYYIASESLLNIIKHSNANKVYLELKEVNMNKFILKIKDDGIGFSGKQFGVGLTDIEERADDIDAKLTIESVINEGVTTTLLFSS